MILCLRTPPPVLASTVVVVVVFIIHGYCVLDSSCRRSLLLLLLLIARSLARRSVLDLEAETSHARAVLVYRRHAVLLGVIGLGEKHAVVALGLLFLAHAARLLFIFSIRKLTSWYP